jgi:hypothetical protein
MAIEKEGTMEEGDKVVHHAERCVSKAYGIRARVMRAHAYEVVQPDDALPTHEYAMVVELGQGHDTAVIVRRSPAGWSCIETHAPHGTRRELRPYRLASLA